MLEKSWIRRWLDVYDLEPIDPRNCWEQEQLQQINALGEWEVREEREQEQRAEGWIKHN